MPRYVEVDIRYAKNFCYLCSEREGAIMSRILKSMEVAFLLRSGYCRGGGNRLYCWVSGTNQEL